MSLDILNGAAHNQSVITLEGSGCDKRKKPYKLCKESAALWCGPAVSLDVSNRFTD